MASDFFKADAIGFPLLLTQLAHAAVICRCCNPDNLLQGCLELLLMNLHRIADTRSVFQSARCFDNHMCSPLHRKGSDCKIIRFPRRPEADSDYLRQIPVICIRICYFRKNRILFFLFSLALIRFQIFILKVLFLQGSRCLFLRILRGKILLFQSIRVLQRNFQFFCFPIFFHENRFLYSCLRAEFSAASASEAPRSAYHFPYCSGVFPHRQMPPECAPDLQRKVSPQRL